MSSSRTCVICSWWCPQQWDSWHWVDEKAQCGIKMCDTRREETCEHFSIVAVQNVAEKVTLGAPVKQFGFMTSMPADKMAPEADNIKEESKLYTSADEMFKSGGDTSKTVVPLFRGRNKEVKVNEKPPMKKHQVAAFERYKDETDIALFHEAGLGKTRSILEIAKYKYLKGDINALLYVAPNRIHQQTEKQQIPLWLDDIPYQVQCLGGASKKKSRPFKDDGSLQILCVNIDTFSTEARWKEIFEWVTYNKTFAVVDESDTIKSTKALRTKRLLYGMNNNKYSGKRLVSSIPKTVARAILTGTPLTASPADVWSQLEYLRPNYFGRNEWSFKAHYIMQKQIDVEVGADKNGNAIKRKVPVALDSDAWQTIHDSSSFEYAQRIYGINEDTYHTIKVQSYFAGPYKKMEELKQQLDRVADWAKLSDISDMPPQQFTVRHLTMSPAQQTAYDEMEEELLTIYNNKVVDAKSKIVALIRLQQITSGFIKGIPLINEDDPEYDADILPSPEIEWFSPNPRLEQCLSDIAGISEPLIVVCRYTAEAARLYEECIKKGLKTMLLTGWKVEGTIEGFQNGQYDVMIANVATLRGFNLQRAHRMIFYSNTFSLSQRLQAEGRIYRIGQEHTCMYFDIIMEGSIDVKIVGALRQHRALFEYVRSTNLKDFLTVWDEVCEVEAAPSSS